MTINERWLLPDGIDELLPERAMAVERLRRALLDDCARWGYRYVIPPLVEFTDSLLVGLGADLDVLTCKFADRLSGRTLGVRADLTPQAARIDAHSLGEPGITRLCYTGSTLHSAQQSVMSGRSPIQLGAEIYGCADREADLEVIDLMLALLKRSGLSEGRRAVTLDVGHVGVYQALMSAAALPHSTEREIFDALQRKSAPDLAPLLASLPTDVKTALTGLSSLHGSVEVIDRARGLFVGIDGIDAVLDELVAVTASVAARHPETDVYIDLAELRGFQYHNGLVFAAYVADHGVAVAKGGRYDNVGSVFGRDRPATGFAFDLKALAALATFDAPEPVWIAAPLDNSDHLLCTAIDELRAAGNTVVVSLNHEIDPRCTEHLVQQDGRWVRAPLVQVEAQ